MKIGVRWFQIAGVLIVLQFLLGGLVSNNVIDPLSHVVLGFVVLGMVVATMVVAIASKPSSRSLIVVSGLLVLLVVLQVPLGSALLEGASDLLSAIHIANAIAILATTFAGFFVVRRWEKKNRM